MAARPIGRGRKEVEDPNNTWNMQLMAALLKGDTTEAQSLLAKGAKIDHQAADPATGKQVTPFLAVAQKAPLDLATLEWIAQLELGPPPSALQPDPNLTPQQNAKAIAAAQAQIITMVAHTPLSKVINPQYDGNQGTVLHYFVKEEKLEALEKFCANRKKISAELSLDDLDASGQSATQLAINLLKPEAAKVLIRHGARHPFHSLVDAMHCQTARACICGQTQLLETILQAGDNPHQKDSNGQTLMHLSVSQPAILDTLLERGLSINVLNAEGQTPLMYVVQNMPKALDVVDSLVARGADVNIGDRLNVSPLMHAIIAYQPALIKKLIEHKADVNARDQFGGSALHWAVVARQKGALELLLSLEVEVNATDFGGETPLHRACTKGCLSSINILLAREQVDINLADKQGRTPLHATVEASQLEVLKALAKRCTDESPFAPTNPKDAKKAAPKKGAAAQPTEPVIATKLNIEAEDGNGNTALQVAVSKNATDMVAVLVATGASVRRNCPKGTLLHEAVWSGNLTMVQTLVESRAIIDARDDDDYSPLHIAAQRGSVDIAEVLLKAGATVDLQDFNTLRTALHIAAERKDDEMIGLLVGPVGKANTQLTNASVRTALHSACLTGHTSSIRKLLNAGAIPFRNPDARGWTPIHAAVSVNCHEAVDWLTTYESVSEGAIQVTTWETYLGDLFAKDDKGWTPLHVACASGANDCVNEMLELLKGVVRDREERKQVLSKDALATKEKEAAGSNEVRSMHNRVANKKAGETVKSILAAEAAAATPYARKNTSNELLEVLSLADNNDRIPFMLAAEYGQSHIARLLVAAKRAELGH